VTLKTAGIITGVVVLLAAARTVWVLDEVLREVRTFNAPTKGIEVYMGTKITRTKTLESGEVVSATFCQGENETYDAFLARMQREWKALCEAVGG